MQSPGQLALKADRVPSQTHQIPGDLQRLCPDHDGCACNHPLSPTSGLTLSGCRSHCLPYPALDFSERTDGTVCKCCTSSEVANLNGPFVSSVISQLAYRFVRDPLTYESQCPGEFCNCGSFANIPNVIVNQLEGWPEGCAHYCYHQGFPTFATYAPTSACICCADTSLRSEQNDFHTYTVTDSEANTDTPASAMGDPHITTLDGRHYTLMQQGTFSLWHLSGLETQFDSENGLVKTVPVDWQMYTRYAGHQAFTKGLLLVDKSGGTVRQVMEMTSQDCQWRARKGDEDWSPVKDDEEISVPDGQDYVTGFRVAKKGARGYKHVHLIVNSKSGKTDKAVLSLSCRPHHNINLQLVMRQRRALMQEIASCRANIENQ